MLVVFFISLDFKSLSSLATKYITKSKTIKGTIHSPIKENQSLMFSPPEEINTPLPNGPFEKLC